MKKRLRIDRIVICLLGLIVASFLIFTICSKLFKTVEQIITKSDMYISSDVSKVKLYDVNYNENGEINRGEKVKISNDNIENNGVKYTEIIYNKEKYLVLSDNLSKEDDIVKEKELYVRTALTFYESNDSLKIKGLIKKGEKVDILEYDYLENGIVHKYKVKYNDNEGYVYGKYLVNTHEASLLNYDEEGNYKIHAARTNTLRGGSAANLDYFPYDKPKFENNVMPTEVRSLYMNSGVVKNVDEYISIAKKANMNAIVVDIKDNTTPAYPAKSMETYSKTNYDKAMNSYEVYKDAIKKINDAGLYSIGRITVFKDSYYIKDNPSSAILDNNGQPFEHNGSYWPSAYQRSVWEFNVSLAVESVKEMGFKEIQFDYVRFPDRTGSLESEGTINLNNTYNEEKAQAIQRFVMYACDSIHEAGAYVSIDVFGESAHNYVTAYGQYWGAISNVADVMSGMPYPDHFSKYEYGFDVPVWTIPYKLLNLWGSNFVMKRQAEIPTPAIVRTWIQTYNTTKSPATTYDSYMVSEEIKGLYDAGLKGGFITWNASSNVEKYTSLISAFGKEY